MYCRSCGKQIRPGAAACPHCGREVDVLSGGSGFWDLLGREHVHEPSSVAPNQTPLQPRAGADAPQKSTSMPQEAKPPADVNRPWWDFRLPGWMQAGACAAAVLLLALALLGLVSKGRIKSQLADLRQQADGWQAQTADARIQAESLQTELTDARTRAENLEAELADARKEADALKAQATAAATENQAPPEALETVSQNAGPTFRPTLPPATGAVPASTASPSGSDANPLRITVEPEDLSNGVYNVSDRIEVSWDWALPDGDDMEYAIWYIDSNDELRPFFNRQNERKKTIQKGDLLQDGVPRPVIVRASRKNGEGEAWWRVILVRRKDG